MGIGGAAGLAALVGALFLCKKRNEQALMKDVQVNQGVELGKSQQSSSEVVNSRHSDLASQAI